MLKVTMGDWAIAAFDNAAVAQHLPTHRLHDIHHAAGGRRFVITSAGRVGIGS
jgi:hypothetical protein